VGEGFEGQEIAVQSTEGENEMKKTALGYLAYLALVALVIGAMAVRAQGPAGATGAVSFGATAQTANIASTPISPGLDPVKWNRGGGYKADCYIILTTVDGASSTLPACNVIYTDADTGTSHTVALTATSAANTKDTIGAGTTTLPFGFFHPKAATAISYSTSGYASGTPATMQYAIHFRLEYVGF
jgi:hypothetical protein